MQVSVQGLEDIKAELDDLKSEIVKGFNTGNKLQAISAIADGFRMVSGAIQTAGQWAGWFVGNIKEAVERVSELQKIADRLGTSLEFISRIKIAAITSNMSMNELEQAFAAFQRNMETFSQGVGESKATFEALGITPQMLQGWGTLENQMMNIIQHLGKIEDPSKRAGAAMRIFGEQGRKLIPLVNANAEAMQALMQQADFLGLTLSGDAGRSLDRVRDNMRLLVEQINALWNRLAIALGPELENLTNELIVAIKTIFEMIGSGKEAESMIKALANAIQPATKSFLAFYTMLLRVQSAFLSLAEFRAKYDPLQGMRNWVMGWTQEDNNRLIASINAMRQSTDQSIANAVEASGRIDAAFDKNRENWKNLIEASKPATQELRAGAEDMKEAATELKEAFKGFSGEVLGNSAEDARKIQEMQFKLWGDMRNHLRSIDGSMQKAPVLRSI